MAVLDQFHQIHLSGVEGESTLFSQFVISVYNVVVISKYICKWWIEYGNYYCRECHQ